MTQPARQRGASEPASSLTGERIGSQQSLRFMPDWAAFDFRLMYAFFQDKGLKASAEALDRLTRLLGHAPRSFDAFATETAAAWKAS